MRCSGARAGARRGQLRPRRPGAPSTATDQCIADQGAAGAPFYAHYDVQGIDSRVALGVVRDPNGQTSVLLWDSDPSGGSGAPARITGERVRWRPAGANPAHRSGSPPWPAAPSRPRPIWLLRMTRRRGASGSRARRCIVWTDRVFAAIKIGCDTPNGDRPGDLGAGRGGALDGRGAAAAAAGGADARDAARRDRCRLVRRAAAGRGAGAASGAGRRARRGRARGAGAGGGAAGGRLRAAADQGRRRRRVGRGRCRAGDERAQSDAASARALLRVASGEPAAAIAEAEAVVARAPGLPQPLYALARARARAGDLVGASRALEAAMVIGPAFVPARLAWAEVRLDLGDPGDRRGSAARAARSGSARAPAARRGRRGRARCARARCRVGGARRALAIRRGSPMRSRLRPARCATRRARASRAIGAARAGQRGRGRRGGADRPAPARPRSRSCWPSWARSIAPLTLVARAERLAAPHMPALAWAEFGVGAGPRAHAGATRASVSAGARGAAAGGARRAGGRRRRRAGGAGRARGRRARPRSGSRRAGAPGRAGDSPAPAGSAPSGSGARRDDEPLRAYVDGSARAPRRQPAAGRRAVLPRARRPRRRLPRRRRVRRDPARAQAQARRARRSRRCAPRTPAA